MYAANRFPVMLYFEGGHVGYAEGGLHDEAMAVRKAGRNGDSRLVHVNDEEFEQMKAEYGEPTINPETGMPEFFLGKIFKAFKKLAPIAVSFIPGVGPVAGAALGAGMGALSGGGLKGALIGGISGGLGGAGAAGKIGGTILGKGASTVAQKALGDAIIGGALGAATGQNPLQAALMSGGTTLLRGQFAPKTPTASAPDAVKASDIPTAAPATMSAAQALQPVERMYSSDALLGGDTLKDMTQLATQEAGGGALPIFNAPSTSATTAGKLTTGKPNFWNRDFLGIKGIPNKYAVPVALAAAAALDASKSKDRTTDSDAMRANFFGPGFSQTGLSAPGGFRLASINPMEDYAKKYFSGGGDVPASGRSGRSSFAVNGPGTGRSDEIPAMLSDGEYVMDAETVALLGDGSPKAGAKRLDDLRVKIRKHKGRKLAKGKFSPNAKSPDKYMAGGRI